MKWYRFLSQLNGAGDVEVDALSNFLNRNSEFGSLRSFRKCA